MFIDAVLRCCANMVMILGLPLHGHVCLWYRLLLQLRILLHGILSRCALGSFLFSIQNVQRCGSSLTLMLFQIQILYSDFVVCSVGDLANEYLKEEVDVCK